MLALNLFSPVNILGLSQASWLRQKTIKAFVEIEVNRTDLLLLLFLFSLSNSLNKINVTMLHVIGRKLWNIDFKNRIKNTINNNNNNRQFDKCASAVLFFAFRKFDKFVVKDV